MMTAAIDEPRQDLEEVWGHKVIDGVSCMAASEIGPVAVGTNGPAVLLNIWEHIELTDKISTVGAAAATAISFSACGRYIASGSDVGVISLFDVKEKKEIKSMSVEDPAYPDDHCITSIASAPKSTYFAVLTTRRLLLFRDIGEHISTIALDGEGRELVWLNKERLACSVGDSIHIWTIESENTSGPGQVTQMLCDNITTNSGSSISSIAISKSDLLAIGTEDGLVCLCEWVNGGKYQLKHALPDTYGSVKQLVWDNSGRFLAALAVGGIIIWDLAEGNVQSHTECRLTSEACKIAFHPKQPLLAAVTSDTCITLFEAGDSSGAPLLSPRVMSSPGAEVQGDVMLAWHQSGRLLVAAKSGSLIVLQIREPGVAKLLGDIKQEKPNAKDRSSPAVANTAAPGAHGLTPSADSIAAQDGVDQNESPPGQGAQSTAPHTPMASPSRLSRNNSRSTSPSCGERPTPDTAASHVTSNQQLDVGCPVGPGLPRTPAIRTHAQMEKHRDNHRGNGHGSAFMSHGGPNSRGNRNMAPQHPPPTIQYMMPGWYPTPASPMSPGAGIPGPMANTPGHRIAAASTGMAPQLVPMGGMMGVVPPGMGGSMPPPQWPMYHHQQLAAAQQWQLQQQQQAAYMHYYGTSTPGPGGSAGSSGVGNGLFHSAMVPPMSTYSNLGPVPGLHGAGDGCEHYMMDQYGGMESSGNSQDRQMQSVLTLYVGNLASRVDEQALMNAFCMFGPVTNIQVIRDKETGLSRGFAFVTFEHPYYANHAMNSINGMVLPGVFEGRTLRVAPSNRAQRSASWSWVA